MDAYDPAREKQAESIPTAYGVGSFGMVVFQVSQENLAVVRDVQRKTAARTEEHQVIGAKPRLEFIAPELDTVSFKVTWLQSFGVDPFAAIAGLRELCASGAAQHLVLGGENFGRYLLLDVTESWRRSGPGGRPLVADAALSLKEYL